MIGEDIIITWAPPAEGGYRALTKYRVEVGNKGQDWRILGTITSGREKQWKRKMEIYDFKQLNLTLVESSLSIKMVNLSQVIRVWKLNHLHIYYLKQASLT